MLFMCHKYFCENHKNVFKRVHSNLIKPDAINPKKSGTEQPFTHTIRFVSREVQKVMYMYSKSCVLYTM